MNVVHRWLCRSAGWTERMHTEALPWATQDVNLRGEVLEIGPGYGVTTRWLARRARTLTAVELDGTMAADLARAFGDAVTVRHADGADLPFGEGSFDTV